MDARVPARVGIAGLFARLRRGPRGRRRAGARGRGAGRLRAVPREPRAARGRAPRGWGVPGGVEINQCGDLRRVDGVGHLNSMSTQVPGAPRRDQRPAAGRVWRLRARGRRL